ncbi:hypothetical protein ACFL1B_03525 [Nanoarchaeota archaeon]
MYNKGQAAIEYLTTNGWIFIVIIIGIGALSYFGFFNPENFVSDKCNFGGQLFCDDHLVKRIDAATTEVNWKLRNSLNKPVIITDIQSLDSEFDVVNPCTTDVIIMPGERENITCNINKGLLKGEKKSIALEITFRKNGTGTPEHKIAGEIFATIT